MALLHVTSPGSGICCFMYIHFTLRVSSLVILISLFYSAILTFTFATASTDIGCYNAVQTSAKCQSVWKPNPNLPHSPIALTSASKYSQMLQCSPGELQCPLILARAFSGLPDSTGSRWSAFMMLWDLTIRIIKHCSSWYLCSGLQETSDGAQTTAQLCRSLQEQARMRHSCAGVFESSHDHCATAQETWCQNCTVVVLSVQQPQDISFIIFVFITITSFATS